MNENARTMILNALDTLGRAVDAGNINYAELLSVYARIEAAVEIAGLREEDNPPFVTSIEYEEEKSEMEWAAQNS